MKKLMMIITAAMALAFTGCKSIPTDAGMYTTAYGIGASTGLVANQTKISDKARNKIVKIVGIVQYVTPATNETFETAWLPIAKEHTQKLVDEGTIDETEGKIIITAFTVIVKGADYVFVRYPKAKIYDDLVRSAVNGFTDGFLTVFKPVDSDVVRGCDNVTYDVEAYLWLRRQVD